MIVLHVPQGWLDDRAIQRRLVMPQSVGTPGRLVVCLRGLALQRGVLGGIVVPKREKSIEKDALSHI
jgi:hypothetical protein